MVMFIIKQMQDTVLYGHDFTCKIFCDFFCFNSRNTLFQIEMSAFKEFLGSLKLIYHATLSWQK